MERLAALGAVPSGRTWQRSDVIVGGRGVFCGALLLFLRHAADGNARRADPRYQVLPMPLITCHLHFGFQGMLLDDIVNFEDSAHKLRRKEQLLPL